MPLLAAGLSLGLVSSLVLERPLASAGMGLAALAAILAPPLGLIAALATVPLHTFTRPLGPLSVSTSELLILASAAGTTLYALWFKRAGQPIKLWPRTSYDWPILLLLASALLSLTASEYLRLSLRELRVLILEPILAFFLLGAWFPGRRIIWPVSAFLCGAAAIALCGLIGLSLGWGVSAAEGVLRLQASYPSPNHLGLLLGRSLPWLLALAWLGGRWRWPAVAGALLVGPALFGTFSVGAWFGSGAALLVLAWLLGGVRILALALALGGAVGVVSLMLLRVERVWSHLQPGSGTTFFRLQLWQSSLAMLRDHPLLGVGLDNFLYLYQQRYILPGAVAEANLSHPHNLVLNFWLSLGVLGLVAALWLLAKSFLLAHRAFTSPATSRVERALALGAIGSLVNFVVHGMVDNSYFLPDLAIVFWLTLAALDQVNRRSSEASVGAPR